MSIDRASMIRRISQPGNTVATMAPNKGRGTLAIPALAAGATTDVTITDTMIRPTTALGVYCGPGTTVPAAGAKGGLNANTLSVAPGTAIVTVRNVGTAASLATDFVLWYNILGGA